VSPEHVIRSAVISHSPDRGWCLRRAQGCQEADAGSINAIREQSTRAFEEMQYPYSSFASASSVC